MNPKARVLRMAALLSSMLAAAAASSAQGAPSPPREDVDAAKIRLLVDRQLLAWEKQDFSIAAPDWLPDGELVSPGGRVPASGMQKAISGYFEKFRDLRITVKSVFISADGTRAAIEWDWDVTRRRDGARGTTHDAIIVDLVGGKIASWREYFDFANSVDAAP